MQNRHKAGDGFKDDHEALDFIAARIADEAQRDGVPLSEVERKMLYFSETAWTLPDIWTIGDEFDLNFEQSAYEKKISKLIKKAVARALKQNHEEFEAWTAAIHHLNKNDRYLNVMIKQAGLGRAFRSARPFYHRWRFWALCICVGTLFSGFTWVLERINPYPGAYSFRGGHHSRFADTVTFSLWAFPVFLIALYGLLRLLLGARKIDGIAARGFEWIFELRKGAG